MKMRVHSRPTRADLVERPLHVIVRDFPETLSQFRAHDVSLEEFGGGTLRDLGRAGPLLDDLESSTAWRPAPSVT